MSILSNVLGSVVFELLDDLKKSYGKRAAVLITKCPLRNLFCKKALMLYNEAYGELYPFFQAV